MEKTEDDSFENQYHGDNHLDDDDYIFTELTNDFASNQSVPSRASNPLVNDPRFKVNALLFQ